MEKVQLSLYQSTESFRYVCVCVCVCVCMCVCVCVCVCVFVCAGQSSLPTKVEFVARPQNSTVILGRPAVMECLAQGHPKPLVSLSRLRECTHTHTHTHSHYSRR